MPTHKHIGPVATFRLGDERLFAIARQALELNSKFGYKYVAVLIFIYLFLDESLGLCDDLSEMNVHSYDWNWDF